MKNTEIESEEPEMNNDLHELFLDELADLFNAEQQLTKALPQLAEAANSDELAEAFRSHLAETQLHVSRIERVFNSLGEAVKNKKCKAMQGLIEEGKDLIEEKKSSSVLDQALIAAAQKVEHYEIAAYGTVCAWAEQMGHVDELSILTETLDEENAADDKLTEIAENLANQDAEKNG